MAYRQYIGARYVPLFDGAWSATKNYEPLTVVEDGNGNSYTSKKDVPAGTPLNDRNYWMLTATFSGAVEQLRRDVNTINDEIVDIDAKNTEQDARLDALETYVSFSKNIVWCGDSYVQATSLGTGYETKRMSYLVSQRLSMNEFNFARGGSGFAPYTGTIDYLQQIRSAADTMTQEQKDKTAYVIFAGTRNDGGHYPQMTAEQFAGHVKNAVDVAITHFPNAEIVIVPMLSNAAPLNSPYTFFNGRMIQGLNQINCQYKRGLKIISKANLWLLGRDDLMMADHAHWTEDGHKFIANMMMSALLGADTSIYYKWATADINGATGLVAIYRQDDIIIVSCDINVGAGVNRGHKFLNVQLPNDIPIVSGRDCIVPIANRNSAGNVCALGFAIIFNEANRTNTVDLTAYTAIGTGSYNVMFMLPCGVS